MFFSEGGTGVTRGFSKEGLSFEKSLLGLLFHTTGEFLIKA